MKERANLKNLCFTCFNKILSYSRITKTNVQTYSLKNGANFRAMAYFNALHVFYL